MHVRRDHGSDERERVVIPILLAAWLITAALTTAAIGRAVKIADQHAAQQQESQPTQPDTTAPECPKLARVTQIGRRSP